MIHKVEEGKNQMGEEVVAFQIAVEEANILCCLLEVGVRVHSSLQVGAAGSYLDSRAHVVQVSFLERVLKTPYVLLGVVAGASLHFDLQVEVVRVHYELLEVEARAPYAHWEEQEAGALMMQIGQAKDLHGPQMFVVMELLLEVWVEENLDGMGEQGIDRAQVVEAPFDLEVVAVVPRRTRMELEEENPDVH